MKEVHLRGYSPEEFILFVAGGRVRRTWKDSGGHSEGGDLSFLAGLLRVWLFDHGHHACL